MIEQPAKQRAARWLLAAIVAAIGMAAVLLWRYTPLAELADPERIAAWLSRAGESAWAPFVAIATFVVGGFIVFPLTLLIAATAVVFEPLLAFAISLTGSLANALALYGVGRGLMRTTVMHAFGDHVERLRHTLDRSGIIAVATVRLVPIAPFTLVNLAAGSIEVRLRDYVLGTALGLMPGTIALTAFGHQLREIFEQPTFANVALLIAVIVAWIAISLAVQRFVAKREN